MIYFGGNAENVSVYLEQLEQFPKASFYLVNYPGYNGSVGKPTEKTVLQNALATYDYLVDECGISSDSIYLIGRSIGSSVAAFVATQRRMKGLILVTPFDNLFNVAKSITSFLFRPFLWTIRSHFNTIKYLESVNIRIMVIFAESDEVIPQASMNKLSRFLTDRASINVVTNANHQNISDFNEYCSMIKDFILERKRGTLG